MGSSAHYRMNSGFVLDTNILPYSLAGDRSITRTLAEEELFISAMTRMEALVYHGADVKYLPKVKGIFEECTVVEISRAIQDLAVEIRIAYKLKLPDAVIATTAVFWTDLCSPLMKHVPGPRKWWRWYGTSASDLPHFIAL